MTSTDDLIIKSILSKLEGEELIKAAGRAGLVQVEIPVTRNGSTHMRKQWIRPDKGEHKDRTRRTTQLKDTSDLHKGESGKYTEQRGKLHQEIVDKIMDQCDKPKAGQKPVAIIMGGGSASGKSTMRKQVIDKQLSDEGIKAGTVDSDEIKEAIPEFSEYKEKDQGSAARLVHKESSDIGAKAIEDIVDQGRNFVYDGTMKSVDKYDDLIKQLKKAGYEIHVYVADVPLEEAYKRSDARAARSGRKVPHDIIEKSHRGVPKTLEHIKDKVDSYQVFDNTDSLNLIASNNYVNPDKYLKFLEKGNVKFRTTSENIGGI